MLRYIVYITLAHPYIIYISLVVLKANEILFLLKDFRDVMAVLSIQLIFL